MELERARRVNLEELESFLRRANHAYRIGEPIISDSHYDALESIYHKRSGKRLPIGDPEEVPKEIQVRLPYHMGSMDKFNYKEGDKPWRRWSANYPDEGFLITGKLDGISALLIYYQNGERKLYSRGDSKVGGDISRILPYLGLPESLPREIYSRYRVREIALRGELIIPQDVFKERLATEYANARNTVAGVTRRLNIDKRKLSYVHTVIYELINLVNRLSPQEQLDLAESMGFRVVPHIGEPVPRSHLTADRLAEYYEQLLERSPYDLDGLVVYSNQPHRRNVEGNPEYARAFKGVDQSYETTVQRVEWHVTKGRRFVPTVIYEQIEIDGSKFTRATGHNAQFIVDNGIGRGAKVKVARAGQVIPQVVEVVEPAEEVELPENSEWDGVHLVLERGKQTGEQTVRMLTQQFSKFNKSVGLKELGPRGLETLVSNLNISTPAEYLETLNDRETLQEQLGKVGLNIYNNFREKVLPDLDYVQLSSGFNLMGSGMSERRLVPIFGSMTTAEMFSLDTEELERRVSTVEGIGRVFARQFAENIDRLEKIIEELPPSLREIVNSNQRKIQQQEEDSVPVQETEFKGKDVLFTGFRNRELEEKLKKLGATVKSSYSKKLDYLVVKDSSVSNKKTESARKDGVEILTVEEVNNRLEATPPAPASVPRSTPRAEPVPKKESPAREPVPKKSRRTPRAKPAPAPEVEPELESEAPPARKPIPKRRRRTLRAKPTPFAPVAPAPEAEPELETTEPEPKRESPAQRKGKPIPKKKRRQPSTTATSRTPRTPQLIKKSDPIPESKLISLDRPVPYLLAKYIGDNQLEALLVKRGFSSLQEFWRSLPHQTRLTILNTNNYDEVSKALAEAGIAKEEEQSEQQSDGEEEEQGDHVGDVIRLDGETHSAVSTHTEPSTGSYAMFDLDGTLTARHGVTIKESIFQHLHSLSESSSIVIISNQYKADPEDWRERETSILEQFTNRGIPVLISASFAKDMYRKPSPALAFLAVEHLLTPIDCDRSFYCGDAAGRRGDFSISDRFFANNVGVPFYTPEQLFAGESAKPVVKNPYAGLELPEPLDPIRVAQELPITRDTRLVVTVGSQASGKSTLARAIADIHGFKHMERDQIRGNFINAVKRELKSQPVVADSTGATEKNRDFGLQSGVLTVFIDIPKKLTFHLDFIRSTTKVGKDARLPAVAIHKYYKSLERPSGENVITLERPVLAEQFVDRYFNYRGLTERGGT